MRLQDDQDRPHTRGVRRALRVTYSAGAAAALCLALAACGSSDPTAMLNTTKIENAIAHSSLEQRGLHAQVNCPSDVRQAKGLRFYCVASVGQVDTDFVVTQMDGAGHVRYEAP